MPRFAANVSTMYQELELPERFPAAAAAGFTAVEFLQPYDWSISQIRSWLEQNSLEMILLNTSPGNPANHEVGLAAVKGEEARFRRLFEQALEYAVGLKTGMIHLLAGRGEHLSEATFVENVRWAASLAASRNVTLLLEPLNQQDVPGYLHSTSDETAALIDTIGCDNVKMQFDFYHLQIMEGNLAKGIKKHLKKIGHIQFSSVPGRHEPQYGEVNLPFLFDFCDEIGYTGWVGCEYSAKTNTPDGLIWAIPYGIGLRE
jgi:hydroxypyruvate isomerase